MSGDRIIIDYNKEYYNECAISEWDNNRKTFIKKIIYWPFNVLNETKIKYDRWITIRFINKNMYGFNTIKTTHISAINKFRILDNYLPIFCGVGCTGNCSTIYNNSQRSEYIKWKSMITRCYNPNHKEYNNYGGNNIVVCNEWLCYEYFCKTLPFVRGYNDWVANGKAGYDLDKDILQRNSQYKIYSVDTCILLPSSINAYLSQINKTNASISNGSKQRLYKLINKE